MSNAAQTFLIPFTVSPSEQITYCKTIISKQRKELLMLRKKQQACTYNHTGLEKKIKLLFPLFNALSLPSNPEQRISQRNNRRIS